MPTKEDSSTSTSSLTTAAKTSEVSSYKEGALATASTKEVHSAPLSAKGVAPPVADYKEKTESSKISEKSLDAGSSIPARDKSAGNKLMTGTHSTASRPAYGEQANNKPHVANTATANTNNRITTDSPKASIPNSENPKADIPKSVISGRDISGAPNTVKSYAGKAINNKPNANISAKNESDSPKHTKPTISETGKNDYKVGARESYPVPKKMSVSNSNNTNTGNDRDIRQTGSSNNQSQNNTSNINNQKKDMSFNNSASHSAPAKSELNRPTLPSLPNYKPREDIHTKSKPENKDLTKSIMQPNRNEADTITHRSGAEASNAAVKESYKTSSSRPATQHIESRNNSNSMQSMNQSNRNITKNETSQITQTTNAHNGHNTNNIINSQAVPTQSAKPLIQSKEKLNHHQRKSKFANQKRSRPPYKHIKSFAESTAQKNEVPRKK